MHHLKERFLKLKVNRNNSKLSTKFAQFFFYCGAKIKKIKNIRCNHKSYFGGRAEGKFAESLQLVIRGAEKQLISAAYWQSRRGRLVRQSRFSICTISNWSLRCFIHCAREKCVLPRTIRMQNGWFGQTPERRAYICQRHKLVGSIVLSLLEIERGAPGQTLRAVVQYNFANRTLCGADSFGAVLAYRLAHNLPRSPIRGVCGWKPEVLRCLLCK